MFRNLTAAQAHELVSRGEVEVIDVRDGNEWSGGHIEGARLVPLEQLRANPKTILTRDSVLFVCAAGVRSQTAARLADGLGLTKVYSLNGGTRGWTKSGYPLVAELDLAV